MTISIVTWNINSIRYRLPLVQKFIKQVKPDILCLQEIKCVNEEFPYDFFKELGYQYITVDGQKSYHGVATVSRIPIIDNKIQKFCGQADCRHIANKFTVDEVSFWINNFYVPAGGDEPNVETNKKFAHKLDFLKELKEFKAIDSKTGEYHILLGDLNIAPLPQDVWDHKKLLKIVSHTPIETEMLTDVYNNGDWSDLIRLKLGQDNKLYSWWSYRSPNWQIADKGRRLDHIWGPKELEPLINEARIWKEFRGEEKPSDHVPLEIKLKTKADS